MITKRCPTFRAVCAALLTLALCHCASQPEQSDNKASTPERVPGEIASLTPSEQSELDSALTLLSTGDLAKAVSELKRLHKRYNSTPVATNLALAYFKQGELAQAQELTQYVLATYPENAQMYNLAGLIHYQKKEFAEAEKAYLTALRINPDYALAHYNLALLYDVYYQEVSNAYEHYLRYLALIDYQDQDTMDWVEQLKYSVEQD